MPKTNEESTLKVPEGADAEVIEEMRAAGELESATEVETPEGGKPAEHVDKPAEEPAPSPRDKDGEGNGEPPAAGEGEGQGDRPAASDREGAQPPNREAKTMPVWKAKEETKKAVEAATSQLRSEFEAKITELGNKQGGATDEDVAKIAEEFSMKPEAAAALIERVTEAVGKRHGIADIRSTLDARAATDREQAEEQGFETEFNDKVTQEALTAAAGDRQITPEVKSKLKELAYETTYAKYRLTDIIRLESANLFPAAAKPAPSGEGSRGGAGRGQAAKVKSLDETTPEDINTMSDDDFDQFSSEIAGGQSRFTRTVVPKKTAAK